MSLVLREKRTSDNERLAKVWTANYGGVTVASRGHEQRPLELPGYIAIEDSEVVGAVTWNQVGDQFEIVTLDAFHDDRGIGTALLEAAIGFARKCRAKRAGSSPRTTTFARCASTSVVAGTWWRSTATQSMNPGSSSPKFPSVAITTSPSATRSNSSCSCDDLQRPVRQGWGTVWATRHSLGIRLAGQT